MTDTGGLGYVVARVLRRTAEALYDDTPALQPAAGAITFTPHDTADRTTGAFLLGEELTLPLDQDGNLVARQPGEGETLEPGAWVASGVYRVRFDVPGPPAGFDIEITAGHTPEAPLDLVTAAPYTPPTGVVVQTILVPAGAVPGHVLAWTGDGAKWQHPVDPQLVRDAVTEYVDGPDTPLIPTSLEIGTVTTTEPGSDATAQIIGDAPNQTLNLSLPRGPVGPVPEHSWAGTVLSFDGRPGVDLRGPAGQPDAYTTIGAGRPDIPGTTPYTAAQLNALPVGHEYRSTTGNQGAWRWRKGNPTTWWCIDGNTGDLALTVFGATGQLVLKRVNDRVSLYFNDVVMPAGSGLYSFFNGGNPPLPTGFRSRDDIQASVRLMTNATIRQMITKHGSTVSWIYQVATDGTHSTTRPTAGLTGTIVWPTAVEWPTTLTF